MKRPYALLLLAFLLGAVNLSYQACGPLKTLGTSTGNPMSGGEPEIGHEHVPPNLPVTQPATHVGSTLANEICIALMRCHSEITATSCLEATLRNTKIPASLGVNDTRFANLNDLILGEGNQLVQPDSQQANLCVQGLQTLGCAEQPMQNAFLTGTQNYDEIYRLLEANEACRKTFVVR